MARLSLAKLERQYRDPLKALQQQRDGASAELTTILDRLGYTGKVTP